MVVETVRRARRRFVTNEVLRHGAYAFSAALVSLIVLLLCGTQVFNWPWLLGLPAAAAAASGYAIWRRLPTCYQIAQRVDRGLETTDTLSTALFFAGSNRRVSADMRSAQWAQAERLARGVDLRRAIPIRTPRAVYAMALLGLVAGSLFALRFGLDRRLNLRPPLPRMVAARWGIGEPPQIVRAQSRITPRSNRREQAGMPPDASQPQIPGELDAATDAVLDTVDVPDVDSHRNGAATGGDRGNGAAQSGPGQSGSEESGGGQPGAGAGQQSRSGESAGLLSKFRDAMSSLLSRVGVQEASAQSGGQSKNDSGSGSQTAKNAGQGGNGQPGDAHSGQPGEDGQEAPGTQSASSDDSARQGVTKQAGNGIGREDGSKDVKLAEQLAAMGKISEIIGKRAANVTGDLTVEVRNSNQQLHVPYAQRAARHSEAGAEISRDEVPLALQSYVQQYFEELRKTPTSPTRASAPPHPGPSPDRKDSK